MPPFQFFVEDDRYEVPTLVLCEASTDGCAEARAKEILLQSPHHHRIDVYVGETLLFMVRRPLRDPQHDPDDRPRIA